MNAPSNANTSGLEVVAWRSTWVGHTGETCHAYHLDRQEADDNAEHMSGASEPLVTAASAQARIAELSERLEASEAMFRLQCGATADVLGEKIAANDRATAAEARADRLEAALVEALPFVESCEYDNGYKPGAVLRVVKNIQFALQQEG